MRVAIYVATLMILAHYLRLRVYSHASSSARAVQWCFELRANMLTVAMLTCWYLAGIKFTMLTILVLHFSVLEFANWSYTKLDQMTTLEELVWGSPNVLHFILRGTWTFASNLMSIHHVSLMVALLERSLNSSGYITWEAWMSALHLVPFHPIDLEIFHMISENFDILVAP